MKLKKFNVHVKMESGADVKREIYVKIMINVNFITRKSLFSEDFKRSVVISLFKLFFVT